MSSISFDYLYFFTPDTPFHDPTGTTLAKKIVSTQGVPVADESV